MKMASAIINHIMQMKPDYTGDHYTKASMSTTSITFSRRVVRQTSLRKTLVNGSNSMAILLANLSQEEFIAKKQFHSRPAQMRKMWTRKWTYKKFPE